MSPMGGSNAQGTRAQGSGSPTGTPLSQWDGGSVGRIANLAKALVRRIRRQPLASLLVVAAGGFVIGGALSFRGGRIVLVAAGRHVGRELLKQVL